MEFSTEITVAGRVIDDGFLDTFVEPMARGIQWLCNSDTLFITDVKHMVVAVTGQADGGKIRRLYIHDHGNKNGGMIGKDWITVDTFENFAPFLTKLRRLFTKDAKVHLGQCEMGQNETLMYLFAATFGAKVYAGTGSDAGAPYNFNFGDYVGCTPAGTMFKEVRRP